MSCKIGYLQPMKSLGWKIDQTEMGKWTTGIPLWQCLTSRYLCCLYRLVCVWHYGTAVLKQDNPEVHFMLRRYTTYEQGTRWVGIKPLVYPAGSSISSLFKIFCENLENHTVWMEHRTVSNHFAFISLIVFYMPQGLTCAHFWSYCLFNHFPLIFWKGHDAWHTPAGNHIS